MARTVLVPQEIVRTGLTHTFEAVDAANGNEFLNNGTTTFIYVKNGGAGATVVTFQTPGLVDGLAVADLTVNIGAGVNQMIGPLPTGFYNQSNGKVFVDFSVGTSVTVAVLRL